MSFKKTVTFSAKVSDYTDGTVSARVQAENSVLNQLVQFIMLNLPSLQQLEKIEIGDSAWSGYPLFDVNSSVPAQVSTYLSGTTFAQLSDVYILGKNKNNWCLSACVDQHVLSLAPVCSLEFQTALNATTARDLSIMIAQVRRHKNSVNRKNVAGAFDLCTFSTSGDDVELTIDFWKTSSTLVFALRGTNDFCFISAGGDVDSFGFSTSNTSTGRTVVFDFSEPMQAAAVTQTLSSVTYRSYDVCLGENYATSYDPFFWGNMSSGGQMLYNSVDAEYTLPIYMHTFVPKSEIYRSMRESRTNYVDLTGANYPRIDSDELYLRKNYIGNTRNIAPILAAYTPGTLYSRSVYSVNGKYYLCLQNGWSSYMIEVSDQGD